MSNIKLINYGIILTFLFFLLSCDKDKNNDNIKVDFNKCPLDITLGEPILETKNHLKEKIFKDNNLSFEKNSIWVGEKYLELKNIEVFGYLIKELNVYSNKEGNVNRVNYLFVDTPYIWDKVEETYGVEKEVDGMRDNGYNSYHIIIADTNNVEFRVAIHPGTTVFQMENIP